ncbi:MAG: hypothetical protein B5M51_00095 [Anaerolinea sp. 4484_236]|nr:MAG: hypothetical protein B5M51_00095 [Anaerolinea sp. 4484_236]
MQRRNNTIHWWALLLVVFGIAILTPRILSLEEEPVWLSTVSDIFGVVTIFVGFVLAGNKERRDEKYYQKLSEERRLQAKDFPFHIVHSAAELSNILLPNPTGEIPIPDRNVPYILRKIPGLKKAFLENGRVLLRGRSKTGKTRAVIELLRGRGTIE